MASPSAQPAPVECPRCHSLDTKFCYFNNYNLQQPRHFCRSCRRYWTLGGALRDVPVGGASRRQVGAPPPHPKRRRRNPPAEERPRLPSPPQAAPPDATFAQVLESPLAEPGGFDEFLRSGFGLDLGLGLGGIDEVGFGVERSTWPFHGEEEEEEEEAWMGGGGGRGGFGPAEGKEL